MYAPASAMRNTAVVGVIWGTGWGNPVRREGLSPAECSYTRTADERDTATIEYFESSPRNANTRKSWTQRYNKGLF